MDAGGRWRPACWDRLNRGTVTPLMARRRRRLRTPLRCDLGRARTPLRASPCRVIKARNGVRALPGDGGLASWRLPGDGRLGRAPYRAIVGPNARPARRPKLRTCIRSGTRLCRCRSTAAFLRSARIWQGRAMTCRACGSPRRPIHCRGRGWRSPNGSCAR